MTKLNLPLRWRITLMTIIITLGSSLAIVLAINMDISRRIPTFTNEIIQIEAGHQGAFGSVGLSPYEKPFGTLEGANEVQVIIEDEVSRIYTTSFIILLISILFSGISTYFMVNKALQPVHDLRHRIKNSNENNLLHHLDVSGPEDEIKELTRSFNQLLTKLNHAFTSQKRFNFAVAHELKTPLAIIKTNIDVLHDHEVKTIEDYAQVVALIEKTVGKMNAVVEGLFDLVNEEQAPLDDEVDLKEVMEHVIEDLELFAKKHQVTLHSHLEPLPLFKGNEVLLYRALYNLVENGIKYNQPHGMVYITCQVTKQTIKIKVIDDGIGIPSSELNKIIQPFYQCELKQNTDGLGLGLFFVSSVLQLHHAHMHIDSIVHEGSTFTLFFPRSQP